MCAFYAVRGIDPEKIVSMSPMKQKFYCAAMVLELERGAKG